MLRNLLLLVLFFVSVVSYAQDRKKAARLFDAGNFEAALEEYLLIHEKARTDAMVNYRIGVCYLNTNIDKPAAIPFLDFVTSLTQFEPNALYLLGRAYHFNMEFDKAIKAFTRFIELGSGSPENRKEAGHYIDYCQNAKELVKFPVRVQFENLGKTVNSGYPEYLPFLPVDESFLMFTSRRNDGSWEKPSGGYYSNVFISNRENGKFIRPVPVEGVNTVGMDENVVGLSNSGNVAVVFRENPNGTSELRLVFRENGVFGKEQVLDEKINSTRHNEIAATLSSDSSAIIFASDRPGGFGGIDLYICRRLPNGKWSDPQNLGPSVNTIYDEDFPSISPDGKTLYFSSKGHTSMGGYDLFRATLNEEKNRFMDVRSMGYPVNTTGDDMNFRVSEDGKYGYLAAVRPEGFGDLDIYRVNFLEVETRFTIFKGHIRAQDTTMTPTATFITVTNLETGEMFGEYQPNQNTLRYVVILPPGRYRFFVESDGFRGFEEDVIVSDDGNLQFEVIHDIFLHPDR
jgi:hypothetical protein